MGDSSLQYGLKGRWVRSRKITEADTGATVAILDVPAGTFIPPYGMAIIILTLFAGGTPSIDIGDGDDPDGWIDTTDITEATVGTYGPTEANTGGDAVAGKYYAEDDTIDAVVSASLTDGDAYVMAYMIDVSDVIAD